MLVLMGIGIPIYASLGVSGIIGIISMHGFVSCIAKLKTFPFNNAADYLMMVVPMFVLMGFMAFAAGISRDAYYVTSKWLNRLPAGVGVATIAAGAVFGACCGSSVACAATIGKAALPEMKERGYDVSLAAGTVAAGGLLGIMIPPSTSLVFYATLTEVSVGDILLAGIIPGLLTASIYGLGLVALSKIYPSLCPVAEKVTWKEKIGALRNFWGVAVLFTVAIGGIYAGVFTPTEGAAVGAMFSLAILLFRKGDKENSWSEKFKKIKVALNDTVYNCCMILLILIGSGLFSYYMVLAGVPAAVNNWVLTLSVPPLMVVILFLIALLPLGMFLDPFSIMVISLPITFPVVCGVLGYNALWYGILVNLMIQIGLLSPPVGLNCYVISSLDTSIPLQSVFKGAMWFVGFTVIVVALIIIFPSLTTVIAAAAKGH
jgi:tripartite ATP-independent transporter DctM subunit